KWLTSDCQWVLFRIPPASRASNTLTLLVCWFLHPLWPGPLQGRCARNRRRLQRGSFPKRPIPSREKTTMFQAPHARWLEKLSRRSKNGKHTPRRRSRWLRPNLEYLEDRTLLTTNFPLTTASWSAVGPSPIVAGQVPGSNPVSGRLTGIATDPGNANV